MSAKQVMPIERPKDEKMTNIYFIRRRDEIKIGRSKNVQQRLRALQTGNTARLKLEFVIPNIEPTMEKHIHSICRRFRINGEWFKEDALAFLLKHPHYRELMRKV
jgi:hypothetical protein